MRGTLIAVATVAVLAGCSTYDSLTQRIAQSITPYRITVVQGNFVSKEAAAQMQVGMSRAQVKQLLGTPLLTDMFHADRWDYVFYFKRGSTNVVQQRDFVVLFAGDSVASWSGGEDLPSNLELLAEIDGDKRGKKKAAVPDVASAATGASEPVAAARRRRRLPWTPRVRRPPTPQQQRPYRQRTPTRSRAGRQPATNAVQTPSATRSRRCALPRRPPTVAVFRRRPNVRRPAADPVPPSAAAASPGHAGNPVGPTGPQSSNGGPTLNAPLTVCAHNFGNGRLSRCPVS